MRSSAAAALSTFDRTYEGLKPGGVGVLEASGDPAFDRTYEGLKRPPVPVIVSVRVRLLTVPMRV